MGTTYLLQHAPKRIYALCTAIPLVFVVVTVFTAGVPEHRRVGVSELAASGACDSAARLQSQADVLCLAGTMHDSCSRPLVISGCRPNAGDCLLSEGGREPEPARPESADRAGEPVSAEASPPELHGSDVLDRRCSKFTLHCPVELVLARILPREIGT